jgi:hypothetical protein
LLAFACVLAAPATVARSEDAEESAAPTIYKWVDANGVAHYTTELSRVPRSVRGSVRSLGSSAPPPGEGFVARDAAPAEAPPSAEPLPEWDVGDEPVPPAAPPPAPVATTPADRGDRWAESDRTPELPGEETAAPATSGGPQQTAAAEPSASAPEPAPVDTEAQRRDLDTRIAALEADIASDEDALKGFLAVPGPENPAEIAYDQSFREVAERLPGRLAELRSLKDERAQLEGP